MSDDQSGSAVKPLDVYVTIQQQCGVGMDFIRPLRLKNVFAETPPTDAVALVKDMCAVFGQNLAATLLTKRPVAYCRDALDRMNARATHLINACDGQLGMGIVKQMMQSNSTFLFQDYEIFTAALDNAKRLVANPVHRATFLCVYPQYFELPVDRVNEKIAEGVTFESCGSSIDSLKRTLIGSDGKAAALTDMMLPPARESLPAPPDMPAPGVPAVLIPLPDPPQSPLMRLHTFLRARGAKGTHVRGRYAQRLIHDCGSPEEALAFIQELQAAGWPHGFMTDLLGSEAAPLRKAGAERILALETLLTETFRMSEYDARFVLLTRKILVNVEPKTLAERIRSALGTEPTAASVNQLLRRHAQPIAEGAYQPPQPKLPVIKPIRVKAPSPPKAVAAPRPALPDPPPPPPSPLRDLMVSAGYPEKTALKWARHLLAHTKNDEEAAVAYLQRFIDAGWHMEALNSVLAQGSALREAGPDRVLELQHALESGCGFERRAATELLAKRNRLLALTADALLAAVDAALGVRDPEPVRRLLTVASYTVTHTPPETLRQYRERLEERSLSVRDDPRLLAEHARESRVVKKAPDAPRKGRMGVALTGNAHVDALLKAGWFAKAARTHLSMFPFLYELPPDALEETLNAMHDELGFERQFFTFRIFDAATKHAAARAELMTEAKRASMFSLEGTRQEAIRELTLYARFGDAATKQTPPPPPSLPEDEDDATVRAKKVAKQLARTPTEEEEAHILAMHRCTLTVMHDTVLRLQRWGIENPFALLRQAPMLLSDNSRALDTIERFIDEWGQPRQGLQDQLDDPHTRAVLFEDPKSFGLERRVREYRNILNMAERFGRWSPEIVKSLDFTHNWTRLYMPIQELALRMAYLHWHGQLIRADEVEDALFLPTRDEFVARLAELMLRQTRR